MLIRYLRSLRPAMAVLWCYLIWYLVTVLNHFQPSPGLWLNSAGISLLIGTALVLSVGVASLRSSGGWSTFRLYLMPFCVSSFASLIKDQGFFLVIPPTPVEQIESLGACGAFLLTVAAAKAVSHRLAGRRERCAQQSVASEQREDAPPTEREC